MILVHCLLSAKLYTPISPGDIYLILVNPVITWGKDNSLAMPSPINPSSCPPWPPALHRRPWLLIPLGHIQILPVCACVCVCAFKPSFHDNLLLFHFDFLLGITYIFKHAYHKCMAQYILYKVNITCVTINKNKTLKYINSPPLMLSRQGISLLPP